MKIKYSIKVAWSDEDKSFIATIEELPGLSAFGDSQEEAVEEAKIAAAGFLKVFEEDGIPIPEPIKTSEYSGQIRLRLGKSLHEKLTIQAKREGVSLNHHMITLLSAGSVQSDINKKIDDLGNCIERIQCSVGNLGDQVNELVEPKSTGSSPITNKTVYLVSDNKNKTKSG
ncbi:MAG: toxin-antitoxin system HicB family antitoxin [Spirochaetes bacterium]|nr:toxin-antitoxin system HicB family antitoxin [Spirochaetota bacterium]